MKKVLFAFILVLTIALLAGTCFAETYTGSGIGRNGEVKVDVIFEDNGTIADIAIAESSETPAIAAYAVERIPSLIMEHQTLNVDAVSGATFTSNAIKNAVKDAMKQAGLDPENYQEPIVYTGEEKSLDADIVIVGAGGSGLSAAIEAAGAGKNVLLVESNAYAGGATLYCGGMVMYAPTAEEAAEFGSLDAESLHQGMKENASPEFFNDALNMDYLNHSLENLQWLKGFYDGDDLVDSHDPGYVPLSSENGVASHTLAITVRPKAEGEDPLVNTWIVDSLVKAAQNAGAEFLLETTADQLLTDADGKVCGIHASDRYGNTYTITAKKVILATGGFGSNYSLLKEHTDMERPFYLGPTSNKGWGIEAGESVGAKTGYANLPDLPGYDSMVYGTVGGLIVNEKAEVLDENDAAIDNLYAVGELTCVQVLDTVHFSAGENSSWNLYSGRIAGAEAAQTIQ